MAKKRWQGREGGRRGEVTKVSSEEMMDFERGNHADGHDYN